jgi:hypothetical protein
VAFKLTTEKKSIKILKDQKKGIIKLETNTYLYLSPDRLILKMKV